MRERIEGVEKKEGGGKFTEGVQKRTLKVRLVYQSTTKRKI